MNKKVTAITLLSLVVVCLLSLIIFLEVPRLKYRYDEVLNGYVVSHVYGSKKEITIPKEYKNKDVVGIGLKAFENQTELEKISFEEGINLVKIDKLAFNNCCNLKEIYFPDSLEYIENNAFLGCTNLEYVKAVGLKRLAGSAFFDCSSLNTALFGSNLEYIGDYAFYNTNLTKLVISRNTKCDENALVIERTENGLVYLSEDVLSYV